MHIGICGKTNVGKSTFFSAATRVDAEISNRVFTTIDPNQGVGYVRAPCPCKEMGVECEPQNSKCVGGTRLIPVKLTDVAGLVPGAHKGRGLGNQFLSDVMEASAIINVVDVSGSTDSEGNPVQPGTHNPVDDILFLEEEMDFWILGILKKNWPELMRKLEATKGKLEEYVHHQLSGLGITVEDAAHALREKPVGKGSTDEELLEFVSILRKRSKPIIVAGNKADVPSSSASIHELSETDFTVIPCSAESELALRKAQEEGDIEYSPGDKDFVILKDMDEKKLRALDFIRENVLKRFGSTGVQETLDHAAFKLLDMIVVYPVENENRLSSGKGHVLPDAFLVPRGTTPKQLAGLIHSDFLDRFVAASDARTKQRIGADAELRDGQIVKIMLSK